MRMMKLTFPNGKECWMNPAEIIAVMEETEYAETEYAPKVVRTALHLAHPWDRQDSTDNLLYVQESVAEVRMKWDLAMAGGGAK